MKILIVEDEKRIASALKKGFVDENFAVDTAEDGEVGDTMLRVEEYDVIILDLMLPKISGLELLKKMRHDYKVTTSVIVLTAKDSVEDKVKGLNLGADDYLAKPFSFEELLARVRAQIRRNTTKENILKVGNLEVDPVKKEVKRSGKKIDITGKEFSLLEYLMRNKGGFLSETQILTHVWDYNYDGLSNVVAVHMRKLRLKIDKAFPKEKPLITTIRGLGYKINE